MNVSFREGFSQNSLVDLKRYETAGVSLAAKIYTLRRENDTKNHGLKKYTTSEGRIFYMCDRSPGRYMMDVSENRGFSPQIIPF